MTVVGRHRIMRYKNMSHTVMHTDLSLSPLWAYLKMRVRVILSVM